MTDERPDPDQLLARLKTEEPGSTPSNRGRLKIFFGYAAGVGKTFTMLEAARAAAASGADIVLGYIEPHNRPETESLLLGLELLPSRLVTYRDITLRELDVDAALKRRPAIVCVDELAHTNAASSRHPKRWQDVRELLEAGISVWTTLNVQHIESLNDVIAQITGIAVKETLPDAVFDQADEIELVDLPPEELLDRLTEGKVYLSDQARTAMQRFFRKANLIALREIAMRRAADRLNVQVQAARLGQTRTTTWQTRERLLVCVGPSPTSAKVIRTAKRMASAMHAHWIAASAETTASTRWSTADQERLAQHMHLAQQLGAEVVTLTGEDVVAEIIQYAQARNVSKIVIGKTTHASGGWLRRPSLVDRLIADSGDIDVYVIRGEQDQVPRAPVTALATTTLHRYGLAAAVMAVATAVSAGFKALGLVDANLVMVYLLGVVFIAATQGRGPSLMASVLAVALFNFFFTEPYYTFQVRDAQYVVVFAVMQVIALTISALTGRVRDQAALARHRERHTDSLFRLSQKLAGASGRQQLVAATEEQVGGIVAGTCVVLLPGSAERVEPGMRRGDRFAEQPPELAVAQWVFDKRTPAGRGTDTLPDAKGLYLPLVSGDRCVGVLAIQRSDEGRRHLSLNDKQLFNMLATQIAMALERDRLAEDAQRLIAQAEAERLRSSLLSAVSHDLRTPLAAIAGASSGLLLQPPTDPIEQRELLTTIHDEVQRLSRLVDNLLQMTRIESGTMQVQRQWQPVEEVVGTALARLDVQLQGRDLHILIPADLPMVAMDGLLIEQVLINLIENAAKYTPAGTPIDIAACQKDTVIEVEVADRGPGLAPGEEQRIFEKFVRGKAAAGAGSRGVGLGLAICQAIIRAHGGGIWAANREGGGARFAFTLPLEPLPATMAPPLEPNP